MFIICILCCTVIRCCIFRVYNVFKWIDELDESHFNVLFKLYIYSSFTGTAIGKIEIYKKYLIGLPCKRTRVSSSQIYTICMKSIYSIR